MLEFSHTEKWEPDCAAVAMQGPYFHFRMRRRQHDKYF